MKSRSGRRAPRRARDAVLLLMMLACAAVLFAQSDEDAELDRLRRQIQNETSRLERTRGQARTTEDELQVIELELDLRTRELEMAVRIRATLDEQRQETVERIRELSVRIDDQQEVLGARLEALYKLGGISYLRMLLSLDQTENPLDAIGMLNFLIQRDARAIRDYRTTKDLLEDQHRDLAQKETRLAEAETEIASRRVAVESAREEKSGLLARLRSESRSQSLRLTELQEKAGRLERLLELLYAEREGRSLDDARIEEFQGALRWPVSGTIVEDFGKQRSERFATFTVSNGVTIQAPPGDPVYAVFGGTVLYSQWFKGYGNLVIVDHGKRIFSLYGNTRAVVVNAGDSVAAGDVIARVGETEEPGVGALYFEMRENNEPVDPGRWLR